MMDMRNKVIKRSRENVKEVVNRFEELFDVDYRKKSFIMINNIPHKFNERKELVPLQKI
jgi:ribosomal protein S17E